MRKFLITALVLFFTVAFWMSVPTGCANIIPPSGGPADSTPPVLVKATPPDSTVNFTGDRITFTFNEEVDLRDPSNNILFSPSFSKEQKIGVKNRTVTVHFTESLSPNTTYVLNFGNAIVDFTEGNPVRNFSYAFSTGPVMDTLQISGKVIVAENANVDTTLMVMLYSDLSDSAVKMPKAKYVTRLDRNGNFRFRNLPADTFAIYAFGGTMGRRSTFQPNQLFAFRNAPVVAGRGDSVVLYAFKEASTSVASNANVNLPGALGKIAGNDKRLRMNPATGQQDLFKEYTISFPVPLKQFDSTKIQLASDSIYTSVPFNTSLDTSKKLVSVKAQWKENTNYHLILQKDFATDTMGRQLLKTDTLSFLSKKNSDYGSLLLRFKNVDSTKNPVLQFVQNGQVVYSASIKSGVLNEPYFQPGDYTLRVFYDANGNGKWDTGKFSEKRQPEMVRPIERSITVKPAWDNEVDIVL